MGAGTYDYLVSADSFQKPAWKNNVLCFHNILAISLRIGFVLVGQRCHHDIVCMLIPANKERNRPKRRYRISSTGTTSSRWELLELWVLHERAQAV